MKAPMTSGTFARWMLATGSCSSNGPPCLPPSSQLTPTSQTPLIPMTCLCFKIRVWLFCITRYAA
uniref:Uncharacterized protein n=1 Tax=Anguilla anguilla TaxID=7936 RepID=A0A0E9QFP6_ANGAN